MKKILQIIFGILLFFGVFKPVFALYDPRSVPNNQFGIHVVDPTSLTDVVPLLNSSGGDWGYVKFVIPETDRNTEKWNSVFRQLGRKHLIPIVRLASQSRSGYWTIPTHDSLRDWPRFLNSLVWPTENRYVILFNEPNHAKEWGNSIDPEGYGATVVELARLLKEASPDYFILPAGLDASAPNSTETMNAETFLRRLVAKNPEYLTTIDGWTSHSYPNPNFSQDPTKDGRGSLRSYIWELQLLASLGETRNLPVLIGETGWIHSEGESFTRSNLSPDIVANFIASAGNSIWRDPIIFAITPFIFDYQTPPFDHFSWRRIGGDGFYPHYYAYQYLSKTAGKPKQKEFYKLSEPVLPQELVAGSQYLFTLDITNFGQVILSGQAGYSFHVEDKSSLWQFSSDFLPEIEPGQTDKVTLAVRTPLRAGTYDLTFYLSNRTTRFPLTTQTVKVVAPPSLSVHAKLGWRKTSTADRVKIIIYDGTNVIQEFSDLTINHGVLSTPGILGIVPDRVYRVVTIVPYYLPRQSIEQIGRGVSVIPNKRFLPLDINNDHKFSIEDIFSMLKTQPQEVIGRFIGP